MESKNGKAARRLGQPADEFRNIEATSPIRAIVAPGAIIITVCTPAPLGEGIAALIRGDPPRIKRQTFTLTATVIASPAGHRRRNPKQRARVPHVLRRITQFRTNNQMEWEIVRSTVDSPVKRETFCIYSWWRRRESNPRFRRYHCSLQILKVTTTAQNGLKSGSTVQICHRLLVPCTPPRKSLRQFAKEMRGI